MSKVCRERAIMLALGISLGGDEPTRSTVPARLVGISDSDGLSSPSFSDPPSLRPPSYSFFLSSVTQITPSGGQNQVAGTSLDSLIFVLKTNRTLRLTTIRYSQFANAVYDGGRPVALIVVHQPQDQPTHPPTGSHWQQNLARLSTTGILSALVHA